MAQIFETLRKLLKKQVKNNVFEHFWKTLIKKMRFLARDPLHNYA